MGALPLPGCHLVAPRVLVVSHEPAGGPGFVAEILRERGVEVQVHVVLEDHENPDTEYPHHDGFDAVMSFGSFWSVYDPDARHWVQPEVDFIRELITHDVPYLGVCFGGQMLAEALGGDVEKAPTPEVGLVSFADAQSVPDGPWFTWHGDRVVLPEGVEVLARNAHAVQVFRSGRAVGTQFHPEANLALVSSWVAAGEDHIPGAMTGAQLLDDVTAHEARLRANCAALIDWFWHEVAELPS